MEAFTHEMKGRVMTMAYHEVPPEVLENSAELVVWAHRAIQLATIKPKKPLWKAISLFVRKTKPKP